MDGFDVNKGRQRWEGGIYNVQSIEIFILFEFSLFSRVISLLVWIVSITTVRVLHI